MSLTSFFYWFSGGAHQYHTLFHCMRNDTLWVTLTVTLDLAVAAGYGVIVHHWWKQQRTLPATPAKAALRNMRNIFIFCCVCGYLFIPLKMFWPAWRLYDVFMAFLVYYTWRYAWGAKDLKVIYNELGRSQFLKDELEKSRNESRQKTFFLNALSHDLRTPLNGLLLQAQVAKISADANDVESLHAAAHEIEQGARAAAELLDRLLQCARLDWVEDPNNLSTFALNDVLTKVLDAARAEASVKGLELRVECPTGVVLNTDRVKLERVLTNLVSNAVKFTDRGGVRLCAEAARDGVEIHVIDTGPGLAPDEQSRVFDEFYQVENRERDRKKGFGLGLAIARRLARQLGGDLDVQSAVGAGSRFSVLLPGVRSTAAATTAPNAARTAAAGLDRRVVIDEAVTIAR